MENSTFYINNFHIIKSDSEIDLFEVPSSFKRRLSSIDKVALSLLFKAFTDKIDEIVFSSTYGEFERLKTIIEQYKTYNEVSPMQFSGSVHNFPAGNFCQIKKINTSYNAISSSQNSLSAGIVKSIISKNNRILFCYADYMEIPNGISFILSKNKISEADIKCEFFQNDIQKENDEFKDFCKFLLKEINTFETPLCKIKRVD